LFWGQAVGMQLSIVVSLTSTALQISAMPFCCLQNYGESTKKSYAYEKDRQHFRTENNQ
jgi:hypothetical protein